VSRNDPDSRPAQTLRDLHAQIAALQTRCAAAEARALADRRARELAEESAARAWRVAFGTCSGRRSA
jgi:hypothetical protein